MAPKLVTRIDRKRCRALAERLADIEPRSEHFIPGPRTEDGALFVADFHLAWIGICQQTRTLEGVVEGTGYRGSDYLAHRLRGRLDEDPRRFSAERLASVDGAELRTWLSDDGNPESSTVDRVEERVELLNDMGNRLLEGYGGTTAGLLAASKGRLAGRTGLLERLARFRAYRDPARKKSFLFIHFLRGAGVLSPVDPDQLGLPVDYHIQRVFLRSGALTLRGPRAAALLDGGEMTEAEDIRIRRAAVEAGHEMARVVPLDRLDLALWMLGRNCCFYGHPPVCSSGPCQLQDQCSFLPSTDLSCEARCPLDGVCAGSGDPAQAAIREPFLDTDLY